MDERNRFEELTDDLSDYFNRFGGDDEDKEYIKSEMERIVNELEYYFNVDYYYYLDDLEDYDLKPIIVKIDKNFPN